MVGSLVIQGHLSKGIVIQCIVLSPSVSNSAPSLFFPTMITQPYIVDSGNTKRWAILRDSGELFLNEVGAVSMPLFYKRNVIVFNL